MTFGCSLLARSGRAAPRPRMFGHVRALECSPEGAVALLPCLARRRCASALCRRAPSRASASCAVVPFGCRWPRASAPRAFRLDLMLACLGAWLPSAPRPRGRVLQGLRLSGSSPRGPRSSSCARAVRPCLASAWGAGNRLDPRARRAGGDGVAPTRVAPGWPTRLVPHISRCRWSTWMPMFEHTFIAQRFPICWRSASRRWLSRSRRPPACARGGLRSPWPAGRWSTLRRSPLTAAFFRDDSHPSGRARSTPTRRDARACRSSARTSPAPTPPARSPSSPAATVTQLWRLTTPPGRSPSPPPPRVNVLPAGVR